MAIAEVSKKTIAELLSLRGRGAVDMIIWDNTGTMHRAMPYALDSGRLMHRTTIQGDEPFA